MKVQKSAKLLIELLASLGAGKDLIVALMHIFKTQEQHVIMDYLIHHLK